MGLDCYARDKLDTEKNFCEAVRPFLGVMALLPHLDIDGRRNHILKVDKGKTMANRPSMCAV